MGLAFVARTFLRKILEHWAISKGTHSMPNALLHWAYPDDLMRDKVQVSQANPGHISLQRNGSFVKDLIFKFENYLPFPIEIGAIEADLKVGQSELIRNLYLSINSHIKQNSPAEIQRSVDLSTTQAQALGHVAGGISRLTLVGVLVFYGAGRRLVKPVKLDLHCALENRLS
jgi:hypothetical protein